MTNRPHYATGSALLVCLVLLVVMTLLVVGGISISTTQEKMTGNTQNKQVSFQAAESALRMGENVAMTTFTPTGNNGAYGERSTPSDTDFPIWESEDVSDWWEIPSLNSQVIMEKYSELYHPPGCDVDQSLEGGGGCTLFTNYRITAKGYGTGTGVTLLQSTFRVENK